MFTDDLAYIDNRVETLSAKIEAIANEDETIRRRLTIPVIGALGATVLIVAAGDGRQFRKARDMAAWLGLVPAEHSTGGKRKRICAPSEHPRGTILLSAPEPRKPCLRALAERLGSKEPWQQSRRYFGQQAHPDRLGDPDTTRHRLSAVKRSSCLSRSFTAKPIAVDVLLDDASIACQPTDDQTVDRPWVGQAEKSAT